MNTAKRIGCLAAAVLAATPTLASGPALVSSGTYVRGDTTGKGLLRERPPHRVRVSAFRIDRHEVTNAEYAAFLNEALAAGEAEVRDGRVLGGPSRIFYCNTSDASATSRIVYDPDANPPFSVPKGTIRPQDDFGRHPVTEVSWFGAVAYAKHHGKRLPTEAEWERAARGGRRDGVYPCGGSGDDPTQLDRNLANIHRSGDPYEGVEPPRTTPVGSYRPNPFGIYDMTGNVAEWCSDWYGDGTYSTHPVDRWPSDPGGPEATTGSRVIRGGAWQYEPFFCRASARSGLPPQTASPVVGFRCVADR
jgi:formylglycine-generating enzyme required for sulfatase activity